MTSSRSRLGVAALAAAAALSLVAGPALGAGVVVHDARGHMIRCGGGGGNPQLAPCAGLGDGGRTTFRHTDRRVAVRTRLAALERSGRRFRLWVDVQNGARRTWSVGVEATPRDRNGHTIFMTGRGVDLRCPIRHRIDYVDDVVRVSVPRRCLDTPAVVRFRLLTEHVRRSWSHAWLDNGLAAALDGRHWTRWLGRA